MKSFLSLLLILFVAACCHQSKNWRKNNKTLYHSVGTLELRTDTPEEGEQYLAGGTVFAIGEHQLITANHLCVSAQKSTGYFVLVYHNGYSLIDHKGPIVIMRQEAKSDLCMLWIENNVLVPLKVSKLLPKMGDKVFIYGSPQGDFGHLTTGFIAQLNKRVRIMYNEGIHHMTVMSLSVSAFSGNSGSPVLNAKGNIIGMLSSGSRLYPVISNSPTYYDFIDFIKR